MLQARFGAGAWALVVGGIAAAMLLAVSSGFTQHSDEETTIAKSLAAMLRASRTVVSRHQERINDPNLGDKGLDGKTVLAQTVKIYQESTGVDPLSIDPNSRHGKLLRAQMDSIVEVIDANQSTINRQGVGFKGFIPSTYGRLVNEVFGRRADGAAEMKVTAPAQLIRNRKARPDEWEAEIIKAKLSAADWPKDQLYAAVTDNKGRTAYRMAVPEYYGQSCLTCHGSPKGEMDLTGYPKEGASEGDLGGVISITLYR